MYRHPAEKVEWKNRFENFVENLYNQDREVIFIGDFNRDLLNDQIKNDWLDFTISLGLNQLIVMPTRVNNRSSTLIDHIYTNMPENITSTCVPNIGISDHHVIFCNRKLNASVPKAIHTTIHSLHMTSHHPGILTRRPSLGSTRYVNVINKVEYILTRVS